MKNRLDAVARNSGALLIAPGEKKRIGPALLANPSGGLVVLVASDGSPIGAWRIACGRSSVDPPLVGPVAGCRGRATIVWSCAGLPDDGCLELRVGGEPVAWLEPGPT